MAAEAEAVVAAGAAVKTAAAMKKLAVVLWAVVPGEGRTNNYQIPDPPR